MFYFIRANGNTAHNNPAYPNCYVPGEPPTYPDNYFNALPYCWEQNIVRIGWPDVGDLRLGNKAGALGQCYDIDTVSPHVRTYLRTFQNMSIGSVVLVPDKDAPGDIYIAQVTGPYNYFHAPPAHPYEHAHRHPAHWDRDEDGVPILYRASQFGIGIQGGMWLRAFAVIDNAANAAEITRKIQEARHNRTGVRQTGR